MQHKAEQASEMVDTLKIGLNGFDIRSGHRLTIQPAAFTPATGEMVGDFVLWEGQKGRKAYYNSDRFNLSIESHRGKVVPMIQLSLPGYCGADNLNPLTKQEAGEVLHDLQKQLDSIGVGCNLEDARVSRLDAFRNVVTTEPFPTFAPVLSLLEGRRMRDTVQFGGTSFRWGSTVAQINCYDKLQEMKEKKLDTSRYTGTNIIRFEHRSLDRRKVRDLYGFATVGDFAKEYDSIGEVYRGEMRGGLFKYSGEDVEVLGQAQLQEDMEMFKRLCGRRWLSAFFEAAGMRWLGERVSPEALAQAILKVSGDRNKAWRNRKKMKDALVMQRMLTKSDAALKTYRTLYDELRGGVLRAA